MGPTGISSRRAPAELLGSGSRNSQDFGREDGCRASWPLLPPPEHVLLIDHGRRRVFPRRASRLLCHALPLVSLECSRWPYLSETGGRLPRNAVHRRKAPASCTIIGSGKAQRTAVTGENRDFSTRKTVSCCKDQPCRASRVQAVTAKSFPPAGAQSVRVRRLGRARALALESVRIFRRQCQQARVCCILNVRML